MSIGVEEHSNALVEDAQERERSGEENESVDSQRGDDSTLLAILLAVVIFSYFFLRTHQDGLVSSFSQLRLKLIHTDKKVMVHKSYN